MKNARKKLNEHHHYFMIVFYALWHRIESQHFARKINRHALMEFTVKTNNNKKNPFLTNLIFSGGCCGCVCTRRHKVRTKCTFYYLFGGAATYTPQITG